MRYLGTLRRLRDAWQSRRDLRQELRRRVRKEAASAETDWRVEKEPLEELERLERLHELQGRWLPRPVGLVALWCLLVVGALVAAVVRWPFPTPTSLSVTASEVAFQPTSAVTVPRIEGVGELYVSGLAEARGDDGVWTSARSAHLRAGESGRVVVESFEVETGGPLRWMWSGGEASVSWQPLGRTGPAAPLVIVLRGLVDGELSSPERDDVRRVELRLGTPDDGVRLTWRARLGAPGVELPPFDVRGVDLVRVHPGADGENLVSGLVSGEVVMAARSEMALPVGYREELRVGLEHGRVVGLRATSSGWQFRLAGRTDSLTVGPVPGRDLRPTVYQAAESTPWIRNGFAAFTLLLSIVTCLWSLAWR